MKKNSYVSESVLYDIIILGAGIAGTSLLYRGLKSGKWLDKKILFVDKDFKYLPEKMISLWSEKNEWYHDYAINSTNKLSVYCNKGNEIRLNIDRYKYYTIDGKHFLKMLRDYIESFSNIVFLTAKVQSAVSLHSHCLVQCQSGSFYGKVIFNSLHLKNRHSVLQDSDQYFLQHFFGVKIRYKSEYPIKKASIMDYRTEQFKNSTSFFYCIPFSDNELFVEYTVFSKNIFSEKVYKSQIDIYLKEVLKLENYSIDYVERGVIPMTDMKYKRFDNRIMNIGIAGGDTRPSSGYTFYNTQKTIDQIIDSSGFDSLKSIYREPVPNRHLLYDSLLLNVLDKDKYNGHQVFTDLFTRCRTATIFKFLNGETSWLEEITIMKSLRPVPFLQQAIKLISRSLKRSNRWG